MKKVISFVVLLAMTLTMAAVPAFAVTDEEAAALADELYAEGLFKGVGFDADGKPLYALDKTATRAEAVTMLVRILGKEAEAQAGSWETPFTDVPNWAMPTVGYAYVNGLTTGTGDTTFSPNDTVSSNMFITLCLRALGYVDGEDGFQWNASADKAAEVGLCKAGEYVDNTQQFLRADMVYIAYNAVHNATKKTVTPATKPGELPEGYEVVDLDDPNCDIWSYNSDGSGKKGINFQFLPSGTIVTSENLKYDAQKSFEDNTRAVMQGLVDLYPNWEWNEFAPGRYVKYRDFSVKGLATANVKVAHSRDLKPDEHNIEIATSGFELHNSRLLMLNLAYFYATDEELSVICKAFDMMEEYFSTREQDRRQPSYGKEYVTAELAEKYGLQLLNEEKTQYGTNKVVKLTDGVGTIEIEYNYNPIECDVALHLSR